MSQQLYCSSHKKQMNSICLTEGCNTMHCPDCAISHRQTHTGFADQKIMNFKDVLSFSVESQVISNQLTPTKKLYSDSLMAKLSNMNGQEFREQVTLKIKTMTNLKVILRNIMKDYFDKLADEYQVILMQQQDDYIKGIKVLKTQIQSEFNISQHHLSDLQVNNLNDSKLLDARFLTPSPRSQKFNFTPSQSKKERDDDDIQGDEIDTLLRKEHIKQSVDINLTPEMVQSVIQTIKEQELMKSQMKQFNKEHTLLKDEFKKDKLTVDSELEKNFKRFLSESFYILKKGQKENYKETIPQQLMQQQQQNTRSLSPISFLQNDSRIQSDSRNYPLDNSMSSMNPDKSQLVQVPHQLKTWEHKQLTLQDLDVNTHDYFLKSPFFHFFNIKDNQIVIQHIGQPDLKLTKQSDQTPNRARFQSTYQIDIKSIALQKSKQQKNPTNILRNVFKGNIEKKTLNSTFAIPKNHRTIALPNREIYLIGGQYDNETVPFVFKYNWDDNQLEEAGRPLNISRSNFGIAALTNFIYVIGGMNEKLGTLKSCEVMDGVSKQWSHIADLNVECRDLSVCAFNNRILYKFGGVGGDDQLNEYIEKYEPQSNRWISFHVQNKNSLKTKFQLYAQSGAVQINQNHIMVFGGSDAGLSEDTDQTFLCEIGTDYCKVVGLNKVNISTKGAIITNTVVQNNRVYAMQLQRDKNGNVHPYKRNMMLYEDKAWKVNY